MTEVCVTNPRGARKTGKEKVLILDRQNLQK